MTVDTALLREIADLHAETIGEIAHSAIHAAADEIDELKQTVESEDKANLRLHLSLDAMHRRAQMAESSARRALDHNKHLIWQLGYFFDEKPVADADKIDMDVVKRGKSGEHVHVWHASFGQQYCVICGIDVEDEVQT